MSNSYVFYANKNGRPTGLPGFVGPKGPQGEQGEQGIQGPQGEPGEVNIDDASITTESTWSSSKTHTEIEAVAEMAEGKTKTYIIDYTNNPTFHSQVDKVSAASIVDISGNTIDADDLNYGDVILVINTDVPDRWVGDYTGTNRDFYKMETQKIDLTGYLTKANPVATGSFSIGRKASTTVGTDSVAMGSECVASGEYSVALGNHSEATVAYAFASGWYGKAYNTAAIAGGRECTAKGEYSTAIGTGNTTGTADENMVAIGRYGVEHNDGEYALTIGNGTGWSDRKDMLKLDWDGNLEVTGDITANGVSMSGLKSEVLNVFSDEVGINLWDEQWEMGSYGNTGKKLISSTDSRNVNPIHITPSTSYYINKRSIKRYYYTKDMEFISYDWSGTKSFTSPSNAYYVNITCTNSSGWTTNCTVNISNPTINDTYYPFGGLRNDIKQLWELGPVTTDTTSAINPIKFTASTDTNRNIIVKQGKICVLHIVGAIRAAVPTGETIPTIITYGSLANIMGANPNHAFGLATTSGNHIVRLYIDETGLGIYNVSAESLSSGESIYGELIVTLP